MRNFKTRVEIGARAVFITVLVLVLLPVQAEAWPLFKDYQIDFGTGTSQVEAGDLPTDVTNFDGHLSASDTDVLNGDLATAMVDGVDWRDTSVDLYLNNYRAEVLSNS